MAFALSGCAGGNKTEGVSGGGNAGKTVTITMQIADGLIKNRQTVEEMIAEFNQVHPEIIVELETLPGGDPKNAKLQTAITTAEMPDIYQLSAANSLTLLADKAGFLYDLSGLEAAQNFSEDVRKSQTVNGKLAALPTGLGFFGVIYNIPLLESVGYAQPPKTWEELLDAGEKLKATNIPLLVYAGQWATAVGASFQWTFGNKQIADPDFRAAYLANQVDWEKYRDVLIEGYNRFNELNAYVLTGSFTYSVDQSYQAFAKGQAAMVFGGTWSAANIDQLNPEFEWGFMNLPYAPEAENSYIYTVEDGLCINAKSEHLEEVKTFMNWFFSKDNYAKIIAAKQNISAMPGAGEVPEVFKNTLDWLNTGRVVSFANSQMTNPVYTKLAQTAQQVTFGTDVNKAADEFILEYNDKHRK
jgi:ABC-type glycerol-3-phosphate transport system substrate-binding protein